MLIIDKNLKILNTGKQYNALSLKIGLNTNFYNQRFKT